MAPFLDQALYTASLMRLRASDLPIDRRHARLAGQWTAPHRDPFDRLLAAQALLEGVPLLNRDTPLDGFAIQHIW